jgi:hypothetical protein
MFVVRAIVALAGDFGQQTIAEGVEDEATAAVSATSVSPTPRAISTAIHAR